MAQGIEPGAMSLEHRVFISVFYSALDMMANKIVKTIPEAMMTRFNKYFFFFSFRRVHPCL
jgi:hypothetical protein